MMTAVSIGGENIGGEHIDNGCDSCDIDDGDARR